MLCQTELKKKLATLLFFFFFFVGDLWDLTCRWSHSNDPCSDCSGRLVRGRAGPLETFRAVAESRVAKGRGDHDQYHIHSWLRDHP